jgi:hypothetical protein
LPCGDLVVDDVIIDKSYSDCIEGVKTIFSPGDQRYVKGYALVVFVWHGVDNSTRVIHLEGWQAKGEITKNELFRQFKQVPFGIWGEVGRGACPFPRAKAFTPKGAKRPE